MGDDFTVDLPPQPTRILKTLLRPGVVRVLVGFPDGSTFGPADLPTDYRLRKGAIGLHAAGVDEAARSIVEKLMRQLGQVEWIEQEPLLDVVTALSGSGPAFLFRFIDALARAGAAVGLDSDQASRLALATVEGAAALAAAADESPAALAEKVASPGGSTRKGLDVLDQDQKLVQLLIATLAAAVQRNREMAAEARTS